MSEMVIGDALVEFVLRPCNLTSYATIAGEQPTIGIGPDDERSIKRSGPAGTWTLFSDYGLFADRRALFSREIGPPDELSAARKAHSPPCWDLLEVEEAEIRLPPKSQDEQDDGTGVGATWLDDRAPAPSYELLVWEQARTVADDEAQLVRRDDRTGRAIGRRV